MSNPGIRRVAPAIGLFFIAPLVAEFLLGDIPIKLLGVLADPGAVIWRRRVAHPRGRSPHRQRLAQHLRPGLRLRGFRRSLHHPDAIQSQLPASESAPSPTSLHSRARDRHVVDRLRAHAAHGVEHLGVDRPGRSAGARPGHNSMARRIGLTVTGVLFTLAAVASTAHEIKQDHFVASKAQFAVSAIVCLVTIVAAFLLPTRSAARTPGRTPSPWLVGAVALVAGSIFLIVPNAWGWIAVAIYLLMDVALISAASVFSNREGWNAQHRLALAGGAALAYAWHAFIQQPAVGSSGTSLRIGNAIFAAALIILLVKAAQRTTASVQSRSRLIFSATFARFPQRPSRLKALALPPSSRRIRLKPSPCAARPADT